ncbi:MAG: TRAM domain-containing protein [Planctomycetota bacterium]|nr:TRAM domain-containing protein [Planctomycetota bacterium]
MPDRDSPTPTTSPTATPSKQNRKGAPDERSFLLVAVRLFFLVLLIVVTMLIVSSTKTVNEFGFSTVLGLIVASAALGLAVVVLDAMTPNKRLTSVVGVYLGLCLGLVAAIAVGTLIDTIAGAWELHEGVGGLYVALTKVILGIVLCYLSVSAVLTTKDDFRLVIPYVEFSKQVRGVRPLVLDTSVLIDGRIGGLAEIQFLDAPLVVPQFVLSELQTLADSGDRMKRAKGRRGLEVVEQLQREAMANLTIEPVASDGRGVDQQLMDLARQSDYRIVTLDSGLAKVGSIQGVRVLNLHTLASVLGTSTTIGDSLRVEITRRGDQRQQGVGYTSDGMMVVVEEAAERVGETLDVDVANFARTAAGTIYFGRIRDLEPGLARGVSHQDTASDSSPQRDGESGPSRANPRRHV